MSPRYIHELPRWPQFHWDRDAIAEPLAEIRHRQGRLLGRASVKPQVGDPAESMRRGSH